jgi:hypothetical protein
MRLLLNFCNQCCGKFMSSLFLKLKVCFFTLSTYRFFARAVDSIKYREIGGYRETKQH